MKPAPPRPAAVALRGAGPGDEAWVIAAHRDHYARTHRFDDTFLPAVRQALAEAAAGRCAARPPGWIALDAGHRVGSLYLNRDGACLRLRLVFVAAAWRERGIGLALLHRAEQAAREAGAAALRVATFAEHAAAGRLYARSGFLRVAEAPVHAFGQGLTEVRWEKPLP